MSNPFANAIAGFLNKERRAEEKKELTWFRRLMKKALKSMSDGGYVRYSVFGIDSFKKRIMIHNINSRLKWEWRRRQIAKGEYYK